MAHVEQKIKPSEKPDILREAVMTKTPDEIEKVYKSLGTVDFTAYALGLACRFCGLETVKMLIKNGAKFDYDAAKIRRLWRCDPLIYDGVNYAAALLDYIGIAELCYLDVPERMYGIQLIPVNERLEVIDYLCGTAEKTGFDKDELLFYSFFSCNRVITDHLKSKGAKIPEMWVKIITEGGWDDETKSKWYDYCYLTQKIRGDDFIPCITALVTELGGQKLHCTEWLWHLGLESRQKNPGFYKFFFENYEFAKINKGKTMKQMIDCGSVDGLAAAAELGWLKTPKKRDEMIAYSAEKEKTECTAWLLEFKNRNFDLASERKKAEKKAERELLADPNSLTELKKIWNFEKRGDGTIIITGYKGNKTGITVPEKICGDTVTAIGEQAFSPDQKRLRAEQREFRKTITEIKLPDTITGIGEFAFSGCKSLTEFEIPPKLAEIPKGMFDRSGLKNITIGGSVKKIGYGAFYWCFDLEKAVICEGANKLDNMVFIGCGKLQSIEMPRSLTEIAPGCIEWKRRNTTIILHKDSCAEKFCVEHNVSFKYKD